MTTSRANDLVAFLTARYDEDEKLTRDLLADAQRTSLTLQDPKLLGTYVPGWHDWPRVEKMCAARLAEIDTKRRIVATFAEIDAHPNRLTYAFMQQQWVALRAVLAAFALPYADHPGYKAGWKP